MVAEPPERLFNIEEYECMIRTGIIRVDEHVELIAGRILMTRWNGTGNATAEPQERLFTTDEYERMIEAGVIREGEHVELIGGRILKMAAMGGRHIATIIRITRVVTPRVEAFADLYAQMRIHLPPYGAPEPDVALVRRRANDYMSGAPNAEDVL